MTESEWLASSDPSAMLRFLTEVSFGPSGLAREEEERRQQRRLTSSDRKLRLFACACCRQADEAIYLVAAECVDVAELLADGLASSRQRGEAYNRSENIPNPVQRLWTQACLRASASGGAFDVATHLGRPGQAHLLREIVGNPFRPMLPAAQVRWVGDLCYRLDNGLLADGIHPDWLTPTVVMLARTAYEERIDASEVEAVAAQPDRTPDSRPAVAGQPRAGGRLGPQQLVTGTLDPARLAVLSDALEEAGCTDEEILRHLRGWERCPHCLGHGRLDDGSGEPLECLHCDYPNPQGWGCWALDLVLGKE